MSKIQWTEETWNPVRGCSRISPGCVNCYAERTAARGLPGHKSPTTGEPFAILTPSGPRWTGKVELIPHMLDVPLKRRKPTTYFVNSMSDLFHEGLSFEDIDRVFAVMALCPQHAFQVLTKRAGRMREYFATSPNPRELPTRKSVIEETIREDHFGDSERSVSIDWPLPNCWAGVSVEDQQRADERIPELLATPAAIRFLSVEPLLGPVDLTHIEFRRATWYNALEDHDGFGLLGAAHQKLDWVIVGGESGPGARPCDVAWIRSIIQQCKAAGVACFVKQFGSVPMESEADWRSRPIARLLNHRNRNKVPADMVPLSLFDPKGGDMTEWPDDLRVRQMPEVRA